MPSVILSATDLKISNIFIARSFESYAGVLFDTVSKSPSKVRTLPWNGPHRVGKHQLALQKQNTAYLLGDSPKTWYSTPLRRQP